MRVKSCARPLFIAGFSLILSACGGSDSSGGGGAQANVPSGATGSLGTDEAAAKSLVTTLVAVDDQAVQGDSKFSQASPFGIPSSVPTGSTRRNLKQSSLKQDATLNCTDFFPVGDSLGGSTVSDCSGSISVSSNFDTFATNNDDFSLPAGAFFNVSFNSVSVQLASGGSPISIGGALSLTVLETTSFLGDANQGAMRLAFTNLTGIDDDGTPFGPESATIDISFDGNGVSYVVDGNRLSGFQITDTGDDDTYTINSGSVVTQHADGYAQVAFSNWNVVDGIPQVGSSVTVTGADGTATITVTSVAAGQVEFNVVFQPASGASQSHTITASASGGQVVVN